LLAVAQVHQSSQFGPLGIDLALHAVGAFSLIFVAQTQVSHEILGLFNGNHAFVWVGWLPISWAGSFILIFHALTFAAKLAGILMDSCPAARRYDFDMICHTISYALR
jgi:hypothetical protein